jgi:hypothetical protein
MTKPRLVSRFGIWVVETLDQFDEALVKQAIAFSRAQLEKQWKTTPNE